MSGNVHNLAQLEEDHPPVRFGAHRVGPPWAILRSSVENPQSNARTGSHGRALPISARIGRRAAVDTLAADPETSLRTLARGEAGISASSARTGPQLVCAGKHPARREAELSPLAKGKQCGCTLHRPCVSDRSAGDAGDMAARSAPAVLRFRALPIARFASKALSLRSDAP